ncbi:type IV pilin protein [Pseudomonadota bacterium]
MNKSHFNQNSAFTLIELSVVLMIIALLVTGIVGGTRLIKSAKMAKLISETSDYVKEFNVFYDRYESYPGDFLGANDMFGASDVYGRTIHPGDGDDLIGGTNYDDYRDTESAGFFHHLYVSGIVSEPEFTGNDVLNIGNSGTDDAISDIDEVAIDQNYPKTPFGSKTFFYVTNDTVDGRYSRSNRIVIATKDSDENSLTPNDAESVDIKTDDGNPFKGKVIAHNEALTSGSNENDSTCTDLAGYNTDLSSEGCILETSLEETDVVFDPTFLASNPGFGDLGEGGSGGGDGDGSDNDCRVPSVSTYTGLESWTTYSAGDLMEFGSTVSGTCSTGYSGTPVITCIADNAWSMADACTATSCTVPLQDATGYENIAAWIDTSDSSSVAFGSDVDEGTTIEGTCDSGYAGSPQTTCTTAPTWDVLTESCDAASCVSETCTIEFNMYCGDNWDCSNDTCCNNTITGASEPTISGDCYNNCTNATFGNDTISNGNNAVGECWVNCSGTMGDDIISNTTWKAYGDCYASWSGTAGNDILIDTGLTAWGDCEQNCSGITQWATDIFRYTGIDSSSTIADFNSGGIDDKIELPSGVTVSITGTGYSRTLSYTGSYTGTLTLQCNNTYHSCNALEGGSWIVKACNIYIDGSPMVDGDCTTPGCMTSEFDSGTCSFND